MRKREPGTKNIPANVLSTLCTPNNPINSCVESCAAGFHSFSKWVLFIWLTVRPINNLQCFITNLFIIHVQFKDIFRAEAIFLLDKMLNFLFTVVLLRFPYVTCQHRHLIQANRGLGRSGFEHGVSYANFAAHKFQHLQGSLLDSSCEVVQAKECAFVCVNSPPCASFNIALSPNENGKFRCELLSEDKFRSPDKLMVSQQFHHYSIKVNDLK